MSDGKIIAGLCLKVPLCAEDVSSLFSYTEQIRAEGFQAGAASRDAEIQRLQFALSDTEALECGTAEKCDKLRAQINSLREALEKILSQESDNGSILSAGNCAEIAYEALASIPEQSLAEYRNKVIEECACIFGGPNTPVSNEEAEAWRNPPAAIRALKEQP